MQLIVESVSQHLRELGLSFYGNANGSSRIPSHCLSGRGEKPGSGAVAVSREVSFTVPQAQCTSGRYHYPLLIVFCGSLLPPRRMVPGPTGKSFH